MKIFSKVTGFIVSIVGLLVFLGSLPALWTVLKDALDTIAESTIPFVSSMTTIMGIIFGAICVIGAIKFLVKNVTQSKREYQRGYRALRRDSASRRRR